MKKEEFVSELIRAHLSGQAYMQMLLYIHNKIFAWPMNSLADTLKSLTDNEHWEDFDFEAAKAEPEAFTQEITFEMRDYADSFLSLMQEKKALSLTKPLCDIWFNAMCIYAPFAEDKGAYFSVATDIIIKNGKHFDEDCLQQFVVQLMDEGLVSEINRLGKALDFIAAILPEKIVQQVNAAYKEIKAEKSIREYGYFQKNEGNKKDLLN